MVILVLSNGTLQEERAELESRGMEFIDVRWANFQYPVDSFPLSSVNVVRWVMDPQDMVFQLSMVEQLARSGIRVINHPSSVMKSDKASIYFLWQMHLKDAVSMPQTLFTRSFSVVRDFVEIHGKIVIKPIAGQAGEGITILEKGVNDSESSINSILNPHHATMIQAFVPNVGYEIRTVLVGDDHAFQYLRVGNGFHHGLARGGSIKNVNDGGPFMNKELLYDCLSTSRKVKGITGLDLLAVDILVGLDGKLWLLEWNPFFAYARTTGIELNIASAIVSFTRSLIRQ
ncbi:MAG: ATP-grasp domain-containing protein [Promethearchaeota archaeon]